MKNVLQRAMSVYFNDDINLTSNFVKIKLLRYLDYTVIYHTLILGNLSAQSANPESILLESIFTEPKGCYLICQELG